MKSWAKPIILFLTLLGFVGVVVLVSGIVPVGASGGHWKITASILHFAMERSIKLRAMSVEVPTLDQEWRVINGAGHFEIGCRQCHGIPGAPATNFLGQLMTAQAPYLPPEMVKWRPEELFLIVKHGVKFTGMPQWPVLKREDEIWSMVAFLKQMPEMSEAEYNKMVYVEAHGEKGKLLQKCLNCHGKDGLGRGVGAFPKLAGQSYEYMKRSLYEYKSGIRKSGPMQLMAASLDEEEIERLSRYFQQLTFKHQGQSSTSNSASIERGRYIAQHGIPEQRVGACMHCHGPGVTYEKKNPQYPQISGQYSQYIKLQLDLILSGNRSESKYVTIMRKAVEGLTEQQKIDVANYYESLFPEEI